MIYIGVVMFCAYEKPDGFSYKSFFIACGDGNMACELVGLDWNFM